MLRDRKTQPIPEFSVRGERNRRHNRARCAKNEGLKNRTAYGIITVVFLKGTGFPVDVRT